MRKCCGLWWLATTWSYVSGGIFFTSPNGTGEIELKNFTNAGFGVGVACGASGRSLVGGVVATYLRGQLVAEGRKPTTGPGTGCFVPGAGESKERDQRL